MIQVLFVCTGNICRSPTAEGVFRAAVERLGLSATVTADSAGTHGYHVGDPPDERAIAAACRRGVDLRSLRARQVVSADFELFDLILAMDRGHLDWLMRRCPADRRSRVRLFLDFAPAFAGQDVPDPYYGGMGDFERTLDLIEAGADGILRHLAPEPGRGEAPSPPR